MQIMCGHSSASLDANPINVWTVIQVWIPITLMYGQSSTSLDTNLINVWTAIHKSGCQSKYFLGSHPHLHMSSTSPDATQLNVWTIIHKSGCQSTYSHSH